MSEFTKQEYILLLEALDLASARHMSESRVGLREKARTYHKDKADVMRKLRSKISEHPEVQP